MSKPRKALTEALRDVVSQMIDAGGGRASDGAAMFERLHPDLLVECGRDLARRQITTLIRSEFKKFRAIGQAAQQVIPGLVMSRLPRLPVCINVPTDDGETLYRPLHRATMGELAACIGARTEQLSHDAAVLRDLRELHAERAQQGAEDDDLVFERAERPTRRPVDQPGAAPPP